MAIKEKWLKRDGIYSISTKLTGLHQFTLGASTDRVCVWHMNDSRALHIHRKIGEMIAVDNQPFSQVEDNGFICLLLTCIRIKIEDTQSKVFFYYINTQYDLLE